MHDRNPEIISRNATRQLNQVFESEMTMASDEVNGLFSRLKPLTVVQIQRYANLVLEDFEVIDLRASMFDEWTEENGVFNVGMRKYGEENVAHGVARLVKYNFITDGTFLNDQEIGFKRKIVKNEVAYFLKDSKENIIAKVKFNQSLNEISRDDRFNFFIDITSSSISR